MLLTTSLHSKGLLKDMNHLQGVCVPDGSEVVHSFSGCLLVHVQLLTQRLQTPPDRTLLHPPGLRIRRLFAPHPHRSPAPVLHSNQPLFPGLERENTALPPSSAPQKTNKNNRSLPENTRPSHFRIQIPECSALARKLRRFGQSERQEASACNIDRPTPFSESRASILFGFCLQNYIFTAQKINNSFVNIIAARKFYILTR